MSDETRTPNANTVRSVFVRAHPFSASTSYEDRRAEFDRFIADVRADGMGRRVASSFAPNVKTLTRSSILWRYLRLLNPPGSRAERAMSDYTPSAEELSSAAVNISRIAEARSRYRQGQSGRATVFA